MKIRTHKLAGALLIGSGLSLMGAGAMAADSPATSATATIITPISISIGSEMSFGNIAVDTNAGTVVLSTAGARTPSGGITLPTATGTVAASAFTVTGEANSTYDITLPASATLSDGVSSVMTVDTFTVAAGASGSVSGSVGTLAAGTGQLLVGATLNVAGSQTAGTYTGNYVVTVNYN